MTEYQLVAEPRVAHDLLPAFQYYEEQQPGLGGEFLVEISAVYDRVVDNPFKYQILSSDLRRALARRFPFSIFFAVEDDVVVVLAVLHSGRDPEEWMGLRS